MMCIMFIAYKLRTYHITFLSIEIHNRYQMDNFLCTLGALFQVFMAVTMKITEVSSLHRLDVLFL